VSNKKEQNARLSAPLKQAQLAKISPAQKVEAIRPALSCAEQNTANPDLYEFHIAEEIESHAVYVKLLNGEWQHLEIILKGCISS